MWRKLGPGPKCLEPTLAHSLARRTGIENPLSYACGKNSYSYQLGPLKGSIGLNRGIERPPPPLTYYSVSFLYIFPIIFQLFFLFISHYVSCCFPMIFLLVSHCFPIVFLLVFLLFSYCVPILFLLVFLIFSYYFPIASYNFPISFPLFFYYCPLLFSWCFRTSFPTWTYHEHMLNYA